MNRSDWREDRRMQKFRDVLSRWEAGALSQLEAAELIGCSERQFRRYRDRFADDGCDGLRDRRLGKPSPKAVSKAELARMLGLYQSTYQGWNVQHFHEHGVRHHAFSWGYTWTKLQLHAAGFVDRAKRRGAHRRKRERKPFEGMMLHQDGSRHAWLAGQPEMDLIVTMDDATSRIYSAFLVDEEGTDSTFQGLLETLLVHGLPCSFYTGRGSHYFFTPEAGGKVDKERPTQVGRALAHLDIEHIAAYSPEARGRSERMFGTLQDRMVKELALTGITTVSEANRWIKDVYLPDHNARFAQAAAQPDSAFVAISDPSQLIEALCIEEERIVSRDNTVAYEGLRLQLPPSPARAHYVKARVKVRQYPDGTLSVFHGPKRLARTTAKGAWIDPAAQRDPAPLGAAQATKKPPVAKELPAGPSVASGSPPSRCGLIALEPVSRARRRPTLTAAPPDAKRPPSRKGNECTP